MCLKNNDLFYIHKTEPGSIKFSTYDRILEMSIRLIAKDLYRLQQEVEELEKLVETAPQKKREELEDRLRKMKAERDRMRRILDGEIDRSS